jgi:hypothetical protein
VTTWLALAALGAYHGVNPAMGWLFAVALGLQERRRAAVLTALPAIAIGHEASVALVVAVVYAAELVAAADVLRVLGALALVGFGAYKLLKPRSHPRWVGMRVSLADLVVWSFLMSSAHGAGLMLFPVLLHADVDGFQPGVSSAVEATAAVMVHTLAMLVTMAAIAVVVYEKLGVGGLRKAWLNLDLVWATAIIAAGAVTLFS